MDKWDSHQLPPSSSALVALSSLSPPSPILSPSALSSLDSGEIPIFISKEVKLQALDSTAINGVTTSLSIETLETFGRSPWRHPGDNSFDCFHTPWKSENLSPECPSVSTENLVSSSRPHTPLRARSKSPAPEGYPYSYDGEVTSDYSMSAFLSASSQYMCAIGKHDPANVQYTSTKPCDDLQIDDKRKFHETHSMVYPLPSPSTPSTRGLPRHRHIQVSSSSESFSDYPTSSCTPGQLPATGSCPTIPRGGGINPVYSQASFVDSNVQRDAIAATLAALESRKCESAPCSPQTARFQLSQVSPDPGVFSMHAQQPFIRPSTRLFPRYLTWLDRTIVHIWIDQEGFRAVEACFKLTGYINKRTLSPLDDIAEFRPTTRQIFNFHYAALEGLPVLRRMTANGDQTRDYISRQASLNLKSNGVYTVRGSETLTLPTLFAIGEDLTAHQVSDLPGLYWRFDYLVDDRRLEPSGKKMLDGEKVLTPLSFSCSPLLLHPLQGKRIKLMHIVKKTVAMKLVAERMEPPGLTASTNESSAASRFIASPKKHIQNTAAQLLTKSHMWNIHKRTRSHANVAMEDDLSPGTEYQASISDSKPATWTSSARRRRASSTGEWSPLSTSPMNRSSTVAQPARNIIPRSRLAELVENTPPVGSTSLAPGFHPPSPNPQQQARPSRASKLSVSIGYGQF